MAGNTASKVTCNPDGSLSVPDQVTIPFIEGDGVGPDIWRASQHVFDTAVKKTYGGKKKITWLPVLAGEASFKKTGNWLPDETLETIREYRVAIKGPLTTPVGGGIRSINVALRQILDLYACVRPVRYYSGVPAPSRHAEQVDMIIYRENTEDVYAGIEFRAGTKEAEELRVLIEKLSGKSIVKNSAIGIKPMSEFGSKRLVEMAVDAAIKLRRPSVTLVHKGNIMKFTEGAFREWGYEIAKAKFGDKVIKEEEAGQGKADGKVVVKDRIADNMFQQIQTRPAEYSVIATGNLNGDYLSDALAAMVGGLGLAPGGNIGNGYAVFEATHGTAPKYAGMDKVNPGSVILSGKMMFDYLGWTEAAERIDHAVGKTIREGIVTYDLAREIKGAKEVPTSKFGEAVAERIE
jgi:isocitrate dehydrogenase